jgi:cell wall-associated NlpC family hydrolase
MLSPPRLIEHGRARLQAHAVLEAAKEVGGDFYSFIERGDGELWFAIGDVSDKGVPAALFMARAVTMLEVAIQTATTPADALAEGSRDEVLGYAGKQPRLVVTGSGVRTVFAPSRPQLSQLPLDMGTHLPWLADWPRDEPVSGQATYAAWVVQLPMRDAHGDLQLVPALIPRGQDVRAGDLPLSRANLLRQAFKLLGERYGWGHDYDGRDCSGFLSEVFASFGVRMPRNTGDQAKSPVFAHEAFDDATSRATRMRAIAALQPGDLVHVPGHVLMVVGFEHGEPWVIHDVQGVSLRGADGTLRRIPLNGVSVTPLLPLQFDAGHDYVDRMTAIVHPLAPLPAAAH